jgi:hypothetical protein
MKLEKKIKRKISKTVKTAVGLQKKPVKRNNFSRQTITAIRQFQKGYCAVNGCSERRFLEADHIRGRDNNTAENCQLLCPYHHRQKTRRDRIRKQITKRLENNSTTK